MKYYKLQLLGEERRLPIVTTNSGIKIAGFDCVGDQSIIKKAALVLSNKLINYFKINDVDYFVTTELKGIPITQELASLLNKDYICLRKSPKIYMGEYINVKGGSITSGEVNYYLSKENSQKLRKTNVVFVDDVFSTGRTMDAIIDICKTLKTNLLGAVFIVKETKPEFTNDFHKRWKYKDCICYSAGLLPLID